MELGDLLTWNGRRWIVRGVDPVSVTGRAVTLEDPESGERVEVALEELPEERGSGRCWVRPDPRGYTETTQCRRW
jgi:hypothetical protein